MTNDSPVPISSSDQTTPPSPAKPDGPCLPSLWKVVVIQAQNALNDKVAQYVLLGLAQVPGVLSEANRETYAHLGALLLALPLILFSPLAGWTSDRFSKRSVMFWCSLAQFLGMVAICIAFYFNLFWTATFCFFILATQATIFSPAKGGIVKELVGEKHLTMANSWTQATGLLAMVAGPWLGGALFRWFAPHNPEKHMAAFWPMFFLAIASSVPVFLALRIRKTPGHKAEPLTWKILIEHFFNLADLFRVKTLRLTAMGVAFFWFSATILALMLVQVAKIIEPVAEQQSEVSGFLLVWVGVGIAVGSVLVGVISTNKIELGLVPLGGLGMAMGAVAVSCVSLGGVLFNCIMFFVGLSSAIFLVPLNAYLQDIVEPKKRGRQLAASSLLDSLGMFMAVIVQGAWVKINFGSKLPLPQSWDDRIWDVKFQFLMLAVLCLATAVYVVRIIPQNFLRFVVLSLIKLIYRVRVVRGDRVPEQGGALLIANHLSYIDAFLISAACDREVRFIAADQFHIMKWIGPFLRLFNVVKVSPTRAKDAIMSVVEAVQAGDLVCIFPEGQITRTGMMNEIRKGFELIARRSQAPVIPVYIDALWGSIFTFERGRFFRKRPKGFTSQVSVSFGDALLPEQATSENAQKAFRQLAVEALPLRLNLQQHMEPNLARRLARGPWGLALVEAGGNRREFSRGILLAQAMWLARRWRGHIVSKRVGVYLPLNAQSVLAHIALRLGGYVPVSVEIGPWDAEEAMLRHELGAVITQKHLLEGTKLQRIDMDQEIKAVDMLHLGMELVLAWIAPIWLVMRRIGRHSRHEGMEAEAVGWISKGVEDDVPQYGSSTHFEVLAHIDQIAATDFLREGEKIFSRIPISSAAGTFVTLWHPLLQGATIIAPPDFGHEEQLARALTEIQPSIYAGEVDLAAELLCLPPENARPARAYYYFTEDGRPLPEILADNLKKRYSLEVCPCAAPAELERVLSISLPQPAKTTSTAEPQAGSKPASAGRILPAHSVREEAAGLVFTAPGGRSLGLAKVRCDGQDFLYFSEPSAPG